MDLAFGQRYAEVFDAELRGEHLRLHSELSRNKPYALVTDEHAGGLSVTICSYEFPGVLSLLTGTLGATGFNIAGGHAFTSNPVELSDSRRRRPGVGRTHRNAPPPLPRARIVDRFDGSSPAEEATEEWIELLRAHLNQVIGLLAQGSEDSLTAARRAVNEAVASRLSQHAVPTDSAMYPVLISFNEHSPELTRMRIVGQDTPFFLYALTTSLSLQGARIQGVEISTKGDQIEDVLDFQDRAGQPISDPNAQNQLRLIVLLTKQFTYFLDRAPDPYAALLRFETLSQQITGRAADEGLSRMLSDPLILAELARLLGTSEYLWEDFIRTQYENILPMLRGQSAGLSHDSSSLRGELTAALDAAHTPRQKRAALNQFKDTHTFRIDVEHILGRETDFFFLSRHLSELADIVIDGALKIAWPEISERHGVPRTVAGLRARYAVFGLGKLGGRALGYASDIELLFVYGDHGSTDGESSITNAEFFERFFSEAVGCIESKREGIFQVDTRLRPHSVAGPLAVSLESFVRYYGRDGEAHSYEKLALTRLRFVSGDASLGERVERLRDDLIYDTDSIALGELRELRAKQLAEKQQAGRLNAKFSPGGLVDLEYTLQILLIQHARRDPSLRTSSLHATLDGLSRAGVVEPQEAERLIRAYRFLRNLINGLRMLRGNAQDLYLPPVDSPEYAHLARRSGYEDKGDLSAAEQLHVEFDAVTAEVRAFVERHLGRDSLPEGAVGNSADLVLSDDPPTELVARVAATAGLRNLDRVLPNLRSLANTGAAREQFSRLVVLAWESLRKTSDPDMALNNWDRFVAAIGDRESHFAQLLRQPRKLDLMLRVFSTSQFLADLLIANPAFLDWSLDPTVVGHTRGRQEMTRDLAAILDDAGRSGRMGALRRFRRREMLRIATRDVCLRRPLPEITAELSALAEVIVDTTLRRIWSDEGNRPGDLQKLCVLAFGKLGGRELNYSSDIDLVAVAELDAMRIGSDAFERAIEHLRADLSDHTPEGTVYRVDFRLRPYGSAGALVTSVDRLLQYYRTSAAAWEIQALLKLRPVAGSLELGERLLSQLAGARGRGAPDSAVGRIRTLRDAAVAESERRGRFDDVKSGVGGIRDIEFAVQAAQLAATDPELRTGNTLAALTLLASRGLLDQKVAEELRGHYIYLRRLEHFLQVYEDRQVHRLPTDRNALEALARRLSPDASVDEFVAELDKRRGRVRELYEQLLTRLQIGE